MPPADGVLKRDASDVDSPDGSDSKKRRVASSSSRGVANLTPEQLAKKRQNDREAQRAIRERTKNQIDTLERKIRDLTSQQPYQELQHVLRQKEGIEAENAEIKKRLASVMSIIEPMVTQAVSFQSTSQYGTPGGPMGGLQQLGTPVSQFPRQNMTSATPSLINSPVPNANTQWHFPAGNAAPAERQNFTNNKEFLQQRQNLAHGLDMGPERLGLDFLLDGNQPRQNISKIPCGAVEATWQHVANKLDTPYMHQYSSRDAGTPGSMTSSNTNLERAAHATLPRNGPPTCPLDSLLLDFLHERQKQAAEGVSTPKLVGPAYPSVSYLLNPAQSMHSHPLSKVFTDILGTFPDLSTLPEKVAVLYIMFLVMRWQISPTQENYDRLPEWMTPRPSQLFTHHPAWIDHLPWPRMRDKLVRDHHEYAFENFFIPFTTTLSLNWPYEPTDTLLSTNDSDELAINPVFERHLRRLDNWSLGPAFQSAFPGLAETFRIKTDGDRR